MTYPFMILTTERVRMTNGKVKWFDENRGFGFIRPDEGGGDVYLRLSPDECNALRPLEDGQPVRFDFQLMESGKMAALNVAKFG